MKNKIVLLSLVTMLLAGTLGIGTALFGADSERIFRLLTVSWILTGMSVGSFFISLVSPKE